MTFWETLRSILNQRPLRLALLIMVIVGGSTLAVVAGDRYEELGYGLVFVLLGPLVVMLIRLPKESRRRD
jgi:hypothetical protein